MHEYGRESVEEDEGNEMADRLLRPESNIGMVYVTFNAAQYIQGFGVFMASGIRKQEMSF